MAIRLACIGRRPIFRRSAQVPFRRALANRRMSQQSIRAVPQGGILARLGLGRPELRAWAMYDWAISAVQTTIMVAVFPIFFKSVAAADLPDATSTQYVALANSIAMALIA